MPQAVLRIEQSGQAPSRPAASVAGLFLSHIELRIDSRVYTCAALQALIAANRFVFISAPAFGDFVVADAYYCSGNETADLRSVPTSDNPECVVKYCASRGGGGGGG